MIKFLRFGMTSGVGLMLDMTLFAAGVALGFWPLAVNIVSAGCAVTFVYFASVRRIFRYHGEFLLTKFLIYLIYQVFAIVAASTVISAISAEVGWPLLVKVAVTPVTLLANFLFMLYLTSTRKSFARGDASDG